MKLHSTATRTRALSPRRREAARRLAAKVEQSAPAQAELPDASTLAHIQRLIGSAVREFSRDPIGSTFRVLTVCLAVAPRMGHAQPLPEWRPRAEPLPGAEGESNRHRSAPEDPFVPPDLSVVMRDPGAAVAAKRGGAYFDLRGPEAGGLGRRLLGRR